MLSNIAVCWVLVEIKDFVLRKFLSQIVAQLWSEWELRLLVIVSLVLQLCLAYWGNKRRIYLGKKLPWVAITSWIIYLSANSVANLVLSTLLSGGSVTAVSNGLIVLWSAFILWHLGGPHNITAYSLEDNAMWLRQFFGLVIQVGEAVYIHFRFRSKNAYSPFHILALPIFIAGVFKAGERIWALRCASEKQLIQSIYPNSAELQLRAIQEMGEHRHVTIQPGRIEVNILRQAYLSSIFLKPLFTDLRFKIQEKVYNQVIDLKRESEDEEEQSKKDEISAEDVFALVGIGLNLVHDLFFTKIPIHTQNVKVSLILHGFCFLSAVSSLIAFSTFDKKPHKPIDVAITYMLLVGAISLDICLFIAHALSKWTIAKLGDTRGSIELYSMLVALRLESIRSTSAISKVAQHDLISYFPEAHENKFVGAIRLLDTENLLQKYKYTNWKPVDSDLKTFIYRHLQRKRHEYLDQLGNGEYGKKQDSDQVSILFNLFDKVPKEVFEKNGIKIDDDNWELDRTYFAQHVFIWHIATGLVYYDDVYHHRRGIVGSFCQISKTLSDYMVYLILLRPTMLPKGFNEMINRDTNDSALRFLSTVNPAILSHQAAKRIFVEGLVHLPEESPMARISRGQSGMAVLEEGRQLAKKLRSLAMEERWDHKKKWEMISEVWMENMIYAASRCSWKEHAQQLRHGGELLTHVALLMAHLGLSTKICIYDSQGQDELQLPDPFNSS